MIDAPSFARAVLGTLERAGYEAWFVGGCVRDALLGRVPGDWDMCTNALPQQIKEALGPMPTVDTGLRHGTVTALSAGRPVEITTYRREAAYTDHRHPDAVTFTRDVGEDLGRRDFTINAMAYHPARGLLDCFGGQDDLRAGVLRCVGEPARRFEEDALRVLRCLRFAANLGFSVEPLTQKALYEKAFLLQGVSAERVQGELTRLLTGEQAPAVIKDYGAVLRLLLPELGEDVALPQGLSAHPAVRWAGLLGKASAPVWEPLLGRLRFSNRQKSQVLALLRALGEPLPLSRSRLCKLLGQLGPALFPLLLELWEQAPEKRPFAAAVREQAQAVLSGPTCLSVGDLAVTGRDLLGVGYAPGPALGKALGWLLEEVQAGGLPNERAALLGAASRLAKG